MEKVYVVYVKYSFDVMKENKYRYDIDVERVFTNLRQAIQYVKNECENQVIGNDDWCYKLRDGEILKCDMYWCGEWQYSYYIKEIGVN